MKSVTRLMYYFVQHPWVPTALFSAIPIGFFIGLLIRGASAQAWIVISAVLIIYSTGMTLFFWLSRRDVMKLMLIIKGQTP
jgi:hypothetical protein